MVPIPFVSLGAFPQRKAYLLAKDPFALHDPNVLLFGDMGMYLAARGDALGTNTNQDSRISLLAVLSLYVLRGSQPSPSVLGL